jgi:hypothetical protein
MIDLIGFHVILRTCRPATLTVALILALIGSYMTPGWAAGDAEETDDRANQDDHPDENCEA